MKRKTLLISGFTPFGRFRYNPGQELLPLVEAERVGNWTIRTVLLPTAFSTSFTTLRERIESIRPHAVISLGMHPGSDAFKLETRARNLRNVEDHRGEKVSPSDQAIDPRGEQFRVSTWPLPNRPPDLGEALPEVRFSFSAGTYICNELYYHLLGYVDMGTLDRPLPALFIHIPPLPGDAVASRDGVRGKSLYQLHQGLMTLLGILLQRIDGRPDCGSGNRCPAMT